MAVITNFTLLIGGIHRNETQLNSSEQLLFVFKYRFLF
jgi:hypothetical protein